MSNYHTVTCYMNHRVAFSQDDHILSYIKLKGRRSEKIRERCKIWIMDFGNVYLREIKRT
jgi:hypothetical protein